MVLAYMLEEMFRTELELIGSQLAARSEAAISSTTYRDTVECHDEEEMFMEDLCREMQLDTFSVSNAL